MSLTGTFVRARMEEKLLLSTRGVSYEKVRVARDLYTHKHDQVVRFLNKMLESASLYYIKNLRNSLMCG